ncbi:MAG: AAA family ATPase [Candidatus Methanomethylophilaceae archaeon]|nr:AAA family ATPase [Candidatus Methanomethylophilaceae archaeon]
MLKIIATGKGGVGKTTTLTALSQIMAAEGKRVIVFDTDPSMNFALAFGIPFDSVATIMEDKEEINHHLEDEGIDIVGEEVLAKNSHLTPEGIRIVVMGAILHGGDGCICSAISLIKILLGYVESTGEYDVALVDSQAGPEVLGRGLASQFDYNIILTEPTAKSSEVSRQVLRMGRDLGVKDTVMVVNMIDEPQDIDMTAEMVGIERSKTFGIRYDRCVVKADKEGGLLADMFPDCDAMSDIRAFASAILRASLSRLPRMRRPVFFMNRI